MIISTDSWDFDTMSLSDQDGFGVQAWESRSSFLDLPIDFPDGGIDEWLPSIWSELMSSPGPSMEDPISDIIIPASTSSPSIVKQQEVAIQTPVVIGHQDGIKKQPMKRKGRPKLDSRNEFSAKEVKWATVIPSRFPRYFKFINRSQRRRAQVRVAQQAYRQRKDGHAKLLEKENADLQSRLSKVQRSFGKLLAITTEADLPLQQLDIVQLLTQEVELSILPRAPFQVDNQASKDTDSKQMFTSAGDLDPSSEMISSTENESHDFSTLSKFQRYERKSFSIPVETTQLLKEPSVSPFDLVPSSPLPFALRLRVEALKRGYELLTSSETSFAALRRAFHRHIFSENREKIIRRICLHLSQTMRAIHGPADGKWGSSVLSASLDPELSRTTLPQTALQSALYSTAVKDPAVMGSMDDSTIEGYIYPEDISRHLLHRGLDITNGSKFISLSPGLVSGCPQAPSLFDEIVDGRQLHLSVRKLLHG